MNPEEEDENIYRIKFKYGDEKDGYLYDLNKYDTDTRVNISNIGYRLIIQFKAGGYLFETSSIFWVLILAYFGTIRRNILMLPLNHCSTKRVRIS